ncbi:MAG TPA: RHS repeat-associated core domain-containing protein [Candidatus Binatus sp.]|jgi:RHS repeat-associated protein|nr:RHS repeat-associated core domain-containing protein [Candidatus Binatus sp.]
MTRSDMFYSYVLSSTSGKWAAGLFIIGVLALAPPAFAQQPDNEQQGLTFYGSYEGGNVDTVNVKNGKVTLHIPLVSYPQRGNLKLSFSLVENNIGYYYTGKFCDAQTGSCTEAFNRAFPDGSPDGIGPVLVMDQDLKLNEQYDQWQVGGGQGSTYVTLLYSAIDSTGAVHSLGFDNSNLSDLHATDGSGYLAVASGGNAYDYLHLPTSWDAYSSGGVHYHYPSASGSGSLWVEPLSISDTDGNTISHGTSGWTDSVGRNIPAVGTMTTSTAGCPTLNLAYQSLIGSATWSVPGPNNAPQTFLFCYTSVTYRTAFFASGVFCTANFCYEASGSQNVVQSVVLPNGTYWAFAYNAANPSDNASIGYADLVEVWLPTGGTISYQYSNWGLVPGVSNQPSYNRNLTQRTLAVGDGTQYSWKYGVNWNTSQFTSTDPLGNDTVYTLSAIFNSAHTAVTSNAYETLRQAYSGSQTSGKVLRSIATTYQAVASPQASHASTLSTVLPISVATTLVDSGQVTTTTYTYNDGGFVNTQPFCLAGPNTDYCYTTPYNGDSPTQTPFGSVTSTTVTDFTGSVLKTVNTQYQQQANSAYKTANLLSLIASTTVLNSSGAQAAKTTYGYDENNGSPQGVYGHQTSISRWLNTSSNIIPCNSTTAGSNVTTCNTFNTQGMVTQTNDPNGNLTKYTYDSTGAFLSQIQYPDTVYNGTATHHIVNESFDANTGLELSSTDENSQTTSNQYDVMRRLTRVSYPDGGSTTYCYTDIGGSTCTQAGAPYKVVATEAITSSLNKTTTSVVDGFGRLSQTQLNSDPSGATYTQTTYDPLGRKYLVYNPTRCSPPTTNCGTETTWGYTTYNYDALNRVKSVAEQDGSTVSASYLGNCTTATDEAGIARESCVDALGRITGVWEAPSSLNYETDYAYDALNNLLSVTQKGSSSANARVRTFTYDSLSRLACAANPEVQAVTCPASVTGSFPAGAITYAYDADGNIITKTAPLPNQTTATSTVTTTYAYDKLNRLTAKTYKDGTINDPYTPPVQFGYDAVALTGCTTTPPSETDTYPIGRRTAMCDGSGATSWKHDQMGRNLVELRYVGTVTGKYETDAYNLAGLPTSVTSLGYSVGYTYNGAGRALGATNYLGSTTKFVSAATYAPSGELASSTLGATSSFTGIVTNNAYSNRLQPILLSAAVTGQSPVFSECFDFHLGVAVNTSPCSFSAYTSGDNGNAYTIVNNRDNTRNQLFTYDSLNRIYNGQSNGSQWGETFTIDPWGNMTNETAISGKTNHEGLNTTAGLNNQLASFGYDAAGNMTRNGSVTYVYDAENRLIATGGYSYIYDGDGQRVEKCTEGTTPGTCATGATGTLYWRGLSSDALSETNLSGTVQNTYVFFNGQRVARLDSAGAVHYYFSDHLGSHGVVENATGTTCEQDVDYYPYGGVEHDYCPNVAQNYKFTGKERDTESNLDEFGARYFGSSLGRFMTPDDGSDQGASDPQSWNLYGYVRNNPLSNTDPTGNACVQGSDGKYHDDNSGGQTCAQVDADNRQSHISATWTATMPPLTREEMHQLSDEITGAGKFPWKGILFITAGGKLVSMTQELSGIQITGLNAGAAGATNAAIGTAEASSLAAKAASTVGNQGAVASSEKVALAAAKEFVGPGSTPIVDRTTGQVVGEISADGTKVYRITSINKPQPYVNLENKTTRGNLHVRF